MFVSYLDFIGLVRHFVLTFRITFLFDIDWLVYFHLCLVRCTDMFLYDILNLTVLTDNCDGGAAAAAGGGGGGGGGGGRVDFIIKSNNPN